MTHSQSDLLREVLRSLGNIPGAVDKRPLSEADDALFPRPPWLESPGQVLQIAGDIALGITDERCSFRRIVQIESSGGGVHVNECCEMFIPANTSATSDYIYVGSIDQDTWLTSGGLRQALNLQLSTEAIELLREHRDDLG